MASPIANCAVVVGAGTGGLSAAKAVAPYFEKVVVLDRDALPDAPAPRPGTPQCRHTHALLAGGAQALEGLFPGFVQRLADSGAVKVHLNQDLIFELPGFGTLPRRDVGVDVICQSRPLLERICRRELERQTNVEIRPKSRVTGLVPTPDGSAVAGVQYENEGELRAVSADVVVDASGRGTLTTAFLEAAGRPRPPVSEIGIDMSYATAVFEAPAGWSVDWKIVNYLAERPKATRSGVVAPMEGGRWIVSLCGIHGDAPPSDLEGFIAFAGTFRTSTIHDAIRSAKCVSDIVRFNLPSCVRRGFDQIESFPCGLIPLGDAICRFNPVFGQGMTVAAQEAAALGRILEARRGGADPFADLAPAFLAAANGLLETPWAVAAGDFAYPQTRGERPPDFEKAQMFQLGLTRLMIEDPDVQKLAAEVNHLLKPRSVLRDPDLIARVMAFARAA